MRVGTLQRSFIASGIIVCSLLTVSSVHAGLPETFEEGNEAFWSGNFEEAVASYEQLVEHGVWDADVFYNLGTAYGRLDRYGPAILNLERAVLLDPSHDEATENLATLRQALARRRTASGVDADLDPPRSFWMNLLSRVTSGQVVIPFLVCWVGFFIVLVLRGTRKGEIGRLVLLIGALLLGSGAIVGGTLVFSKASYDSEVREAIATSEGQSSLREGPGERFRRAFESLEGDRLRVLDREGGWIHLRDDEGHEGWGRVRDFGELRQR